MNVKQTSSDQVSDSESDWQKTSFSNLIRYVPSGTYFARLKVKGKLIRRSLKTKTLSVAKLRLADLEKMERRRATSSTAVLQGKMTFGNALAAYKERLQNNPAVKPSTKEYYSFRIKALLESWPGLEKKDVSQISNSECAAWGADNARQTSSSSHNHTVSILRHVFQIAIENGARYDNPALAAKRAKERTKKQIKLPESDQFEKLVREIRNSGSGFAQPAGDLVEFLAYGGFRKSEAKYITWEDCDFVRGEITVKGHPETGTKNSEIRRVPMISEMRRLLENIKNEQPDALPNESVMRVYECKKSIGTACKKLGITRFTHHDLRHLFATRCIESGVDIPTVSRWLGHKDGGALAMKVYGHLRNQHSTSMAQKVVFSETPQTTIASLPLQKNEPTTAEPQKKTPAQAKAKYSYPWWASNEAIEIFWGQANEPVQIVPSPKYLQSAKAAMGREVFEQELSEPQALLDELLERVGASTMEKLKAKISPSIKQQTA